MKEKKRGHYVAIKLTDEEYELLNNEAKLFSLPISSYMRMRLLSPKGEAFRTPRTPKGEAFSTTPAPLTDEDRNIIIEALQERIKKDGNKGGKKE